MKKYVAKFLLPTLFIALMLIASGCSLVKPMELKRVNKFKVEEQKGGGARLITNLTLHNPNGFSYTINSVDIDVYIEQVLIGKLMIPQKMEVAADSDFKGDFYIDVGFPKVLLLGTTVLPKLKKGAVEVHLKGSANTSIWFFTKNINLDKVEKVRFK